LVRERARIRELLVRAHAFVLPTYYTREAQPRSIIEALNAGTPVVVTRHRSIPEYVFDDVNGFLVPMRSPEAVAHAIRRLMDRNVWKRMALSARQSYEDGFETDSIKAQMCAAMTRSSEVSPQ
jgi:glycosyltransferase involved in cell wall biosynthesis